VWNGLLAEPELHFTKLAGQLWGRRVCVLSQSLWGYGRGMLTARRRRAAVAELVADLTQELELGLSRFLHFIQTDDVVRSEAAGAQPLRVWQRDTGRRT